MARSSPFDEHISEIETQHNLPPGSLAKRFDNGDEWSLSITLSTLIETQLALLIAEATDSRLLPLFSRLELGTSQSGKIAFASALGFLDDRQRRLIRVLVEARNKAAHDIAHSDFTFSNYRLSMTKDARKAFDKALLEYFADHLRDDFRTELETSPVRLIKLTALILLYQLKWQRDAIIEARQKEADDKKHAEDTIVQLATRLHEAGLLTTFFLVATLSLLG